MKLLTSYESRELDRETIKKGVPELILMETASEKIKSEILKSLSKSKIKSPRILIIAGKGNNGGDGVSTARKLLTDHIDVKVIMIGARENLSEACEVQVKSFEIAGGKVLFTSNPELVKSEILKYHPHILIDSIVGTGLSGRLRKPADEVVKIVNELKNKIKFKVIAVDIPTGVISDGPTPPDNPMIKADVTITFGYPKLGIADYPAKNFTGKVMVAEIGFTKESEILKKVKRELFTIEDARKIFQPRSGDVHKGKMGHIAVIGGSTGITGAVYIASFSALRSGAGLVSAVLPESFAKYGENFPEIMIYPAPESNGCLSPQALEPVLKFTENKTVLIGNGSGRCQEVSEFVRRFVLKFKGIIVIDADGINSLAGDLSILADSPAKLKVITPHIGEMARLTGQSAELVSENKEVIAKDVAVQTNSVVVLKSAVTVTAFPDGRTFWNSSGTPALAVAGSGDVLAGVVSTFAHRFGIYGVPLAVFVHGLAGEIAERKLHTESLKPFDIINAIPLAIRKLSS